MAIDKEKNTQILVTFPKDLLSRVDDYRFDNRIDNRNAAIRRLIQIGLSRGENNDNNE